MEKIFSYVEDHRLNGKVEVADATILREAEDFRLIEGAFVVPPVDTGGMGTVEAAIAVAFGKRWQWCNPDGYFGWVALEDRPGLSSEVVMEVPRPCGCGHEAGPLAPHPITKFCF